MLAQQRAVSRQRPQSIGQEIAARLAQAFREDDSRLSPIAALPDRQARAEAIDETVERMLAAVPAATPFNDLIGPFYDTAGLEKWTGKTRQAIGKWRKAGKVLAIVTTAGRILYPSFQFGPQAELLPRLPEVLQTLTRQMPNLLTQARWLNTASPRFDGRRAADLLREGRGDEVLAAARQDTRRLAA